MSGAKTTLSLWIEVTEHCQIKCRFCYNAWRSENAKHHRHMSLECVEKLMAFASAYADDYELKSIMAGGDATAHPNWREIAKRLRAFGAVEIVTHGTTLSEHDIRFLRDEKIEIQFSIPSLKAENYRYLTGGACLENAMKSVARAVHYGVPMSISAVITSRNIDELDDLVELCNTAVPLSLILNKFIASGRGALYEAALEIDHDEFLGATKAAMTKNNGPTNILISGHFSGVRGRKIASPKITISSSGDLHLCSLAASRVGTVFQESENVIQSYLGFWTGSGSIDGCLCSQQAH